MLLVANSTPIVDLDSRLNSLRVNRESTSDRGQASQPAVMLYECPASGYGDARLLQDELLSEIATPMRVLEGRTTFRHQSPRSGRPIRTPPPRQPNQPYSRNSLQTHLEQVIVVAAVAHLMSNYSLRALVGEEAGGGLSGRRAGVRWWRSPRAAWLGWGSKSRGARRG